MSFVSTNTAHIFFNTFKNFPKSVCQDRYNFNKNEKKERVILFGELDFMTSILRTHNTNYSLK